MASIIAGKSMSQFITKITSRDARFPLGPGAGSDAVHIDAVYSYAVCELHTDGPHKGSGLAFTVGAGNELVCQAIEFLAAELKGYEIEELMSQFGSIQKKTLRPHTIPLARPSQRSRPTGPGRHYQCLL